MSSKRAKKPAAEPKTPVTTEREAPLATLVARLSRENLENLLISQVEAGKLPTGEIKAHLPEAQQAAVLPRAKAITLGATRTGTGYFDDLDDELLTMILNHLPTQTRLTCAMAVCKAWRTLKDEPKLWHDVCIAGCGTRGCRQHSVPTCGTSYMLPRG